MFSRIAMLLLTFALPTVAAASDVFSAAIPTPIVDSPTTGRPAASSESAATTTLADLPENRWTADQVARQAAAQSSAANLIEAERSTISSSISRDDARQCAQAAMIQHVLRDLACYERSRSVAQALTSYYQLVFLERRQLLLADAGETLDRLLRLAEKADELELKDGDRFELDKRRLQLSDQQAEAVGANMKLRIALAELLGRPFDEIAVASFDAGDRDAEKNATDEPMAQWVAIAMAQRCDLKAIQSLCRSLSEDSLPAARQLLGSLQPGLGLAVALASRKPLLTALHSDDRSAAELCHRRQQCLQLQAARQSQIEVQVRLAFIDRQTAANRLPIARRIAQIDAQRTRESAKAIELDQAQPGADLLATLDELQAQGSVIERQSAYALADIKLREAAGTLLSDY